MNHRLIRSKAIDSAVRKKAWSLGRDPALLAKFEEWLHGLVEAAQKRAGRELTTDEALDCFHVANFEDFDRDDKSPAALMAHGMSNEIARLRAALLAAGLPLPAES